MTKEPKTTHTPKTTHSFHRKLLEGLPHAMRMSMEKVLFRGKTPEDVQIEIEKQRRYESTHTETPST